MKKIRICGAQIPVVGDIDKNIITIIRAIDYAAVENADILLTPEGSLSGYTPHFDAEKAKKGLDQIVGYAVSKNIGLALGTCFYEGENCSNEIRFYDKKGNLLGYHTKTLVCGTMEENPQGEINDYTVEPLKVFVFNGITIGGLICNDMWANPGCTPMPDPNLTWQLRKMGAKIIFHAVNGGRGDDKDAAELIWNYHESNLRMRTNASRLYTVTVDNSYPLHLDCSAPGGVISPDGKWIVKTQPKGLHYYCCDIEVE